MDISSPSLAQMLRVVCPYPTQQRDVGAALIACRLTLMASQRSARGTQTREVGSGSATLSWDGSRATLFLGSVESSCVDVEHPERLEFEYMQHIDVLAQAFFGSDQPLRALHVGGAACALPWAWAKRRLGSRQTAIEVDAQLVEAVRDWFDMPRSPELKIRVEDGRRVLDTTRESSWDVIVRDAFDHGVVPSHLTTREAARAAARALRPGGFYALNAGHGGGADARTEIEALADAFEVVVVIADPKVGRNGRRGNVVLCAFSPPRDEDGQIVGSSPEALCDEVDRLLRRLPLPARIMRGQEVRRWQAGAKSLRDAQVGWVPQ